MFRVSYRRSASALAAATAFVFLTAACGGGETDTAAKPAESSSAPADSKPAEQPAGGDNAKICADATQIGLDMTGKMTELMADPAAGRKAYDEAAARFKDLAGQASGDLATALNDMSALYASLKFDESDPTKAIAAVTEAAKKVQDTSTALAKACTPA
ncbi:hypothetical protein SAMN05421505_11513 [Sinosporangium album]|uniref:Uncharacterized protein n=1 Tax=Sinosporangium album TaxID=504805 RepID=A0A1G8C042_9ACTN|nr:hypothetical protein [Sinosporangium album]SDH38861.1 hypothetical protein SAMN05421505_11513 [Sinosporangium album]